MRSSRQLTFVLAGVVGLVACSSTLQGGHPGVQATQSNSAELGRALQQTPTSGRQAQGKAHAGVHPGRVSAGGSGGSGPSGARGAPGAPGAGQQPGPTSTLKPTVATAVSQGITPTSITIGIFEADFGGLQNVKGFSTGDPAIQAQAVANYTNQHGGIAGRKIRLVFAKESATSDNWSADEQGICTTFTEQAKVFAVLYPLESIGDTLLPCLAQHNTPLLADGGGQLDQQGMNQYSQYLYYVGSLNLDRISRAYIDGLATQGFFGAGTRIGLVRDDGAAYTRATNDILIPALASHGLKLTAQAAINNHTSIGDSAQQMPNVVLKFEQANVNRVLFLDNGVLAPLFVTQAQSQGYYPKYGLNSMSNPNFFVQNESPTTLAGSIGVGWVPALDVMKAQEGNPGPAANLCYQIMAAAGQSNVDRSGVIVQHAYCDGMFLLQRALARTSTLTPTGLQAQVTNLGTSFSAAQTFTTRFAPGRQDGAADMRYFGYNMGCTCFQYTSGLLPVP